MKVQDWIFSIRYCGEDARVMDRRAVVGPARAATVEAALMGVPEMARVEIRANEMVRKFIDGLLDPEKSGYYIPSSVASTSPWLVCIGSIQEVIQ